MENLFRDDAKKAKKRKKTAKATLSFAMDDEGDDDGDLNDDNSRQNDQDDRDESPAKRKKLKKNPNVDTSFLPDREREEAERKERERLRLEWLGKQEQMKKEDIEVVYSYWDGSGHRKSVTVSFTGTTCLGNISCLLKFMASARKAMISVVSLKNVVNSFPNYEALVWTT